MTSSDTISLTEAHAGIGEHARRVAYTRRPIRIKRAGKPLVKIVPDDAYVVPDEHAAAYREWCAQRGLVAAA